MWALSSVHSVHLNNGREMQDKMPIFSDSRFVLNCILNDFRFLVLLSDEHISHIFRIFVIKFA